MKSILLDEPNNRLFNNPKLYRKLFLSIVLSVLSITYSLATDYYFSSSTGDDNRSSVQAQSSSTPWRSIDKLNLIASQLRGGDRILFRSGDTFYGSLRISRGGSAGNPIIYTSYGSGAKPIITSMIRVNNWVSRGNGIYEATLSGIDSESIQILTINNQLKEMGRYPNAGAANDGYLMISSVNNDLSIQGPNLPSNYVGGEIVIRKNNWIIDRHEISYNAGGTVSFLKNSITVYNPLKGFGFFIQNHINTLDQEGEWAYSKTDKKLYGYFGSQNPNNLNVQVATKDNIIITNKYIQNLTFSNLSLMGSNLDLFKIENSANVQILNCQLMFAGQNAIFSTATPDFVVRNNTIDYSLSGGVFFQFSTPRATIEGNRIDNTMPFQGMLSSSDLKGSAIYISGNSNNSQVVRNQIFNTGFNGIHFGGNYTVIKNNLIDNFCLLKQDGGGIYTNSEGIAGGNNEGREIAGNIILRGMGAVGGSNVKYKLAEGIYIDDNAMGIKIYDNTISEISAKGLYIHNNSNVEVYNNLFHKTPFQLQITHDLTGNPVRNVRLEGNQFSSVLADELPYSIASINNDINEMVISNNNYFLDPYNADLVFRSQSPNDGPLGNKRSLQNWRSTFGFDGNSVKPSFSLEKYVVKNSTTIKESDFNSNLNIVSAVYNATSSLNNGMWKIDPSSTSNGSAFIQIGSVSSGDEILVEFDTRSTSPDQTVDLLLEKTFNQNQEGTLFNFVTSSEMKKVKLLLKVNVATGNESLVFRFPRTIQSLFIDNFKVSKVVTEPINPDDQIFFQYNFSNTSVTYPLSGVYKDGKDQVFSGSINIPAYGSVLLAKIEDGAPTTNLPPSVSISDPIQNQEFVAGTQIVIKADASDPEGQIQKVEFFVDDVIVGTDTSSPYQYTLNNAKIGSSVLKAKVFDSANQTAESTRITIKVNSSTGQNLPPSVNISNPINNQNFTQGQDILFSANASDPENKIARVEFFYDENMIGLVTSPPYQVVWKNAPLGPHVLKAKVFDDQGLTAESSRITIAVNPVTTQNQAPSVSIVTPTQNQSFTQGQDILFSANASDPENKIAWVEFFYDENMIGLVTSPPYQVVWKNAPLGPHVLKAKVFDDKGLTAESSRVTIAVNPVPTQNQAPSVSIVTPTQNQSFTQGQDILFSANASDPENKIAWVEFFYDENMIGLVTSPPYQVVWKNAPLGPHVLKAKVFDDKGLTAESSRVTIAVNPVPTQNQAPSVSIVTPTQNQSFTQGQDILFSANASDPENKIAWVEFFYDENMIGLVTSPPYQVVWKNAPLGPHVLKAKVFDDKGLTAESSRVTIAVNPVPTQNQAPSISIVTPTQNQTYTQGETVTIRTSPSDPENRIARVEFFANDIQLGSVSSAPYDLVVRNVTAGSYIVRTKVFDQEGLSGESSRINVSVVSSAAFRTNGLELVSPTMDQQYTSSDIISVEIGKEFADINYDSLEVYVSGLKIGATSELNFNIPSDKMSAGANLITVKAFKFGAETSSDWVSVNVLKDQVEVQNNPIDNFGEEAYTFEFGPNPTSDVLNIYLGKMFQGEDVEIHIYSVNGTTLDVVETNTNIGKVTIDVSSYSQGVYFIRVLGKVFIYDTKRFIKN